MVYVLHYNFAVFLRALHFMYTLPLYLTAFSIRYALKSSLYVDIRVEQLRLQLGPAVNCHLLFAESLILQASVSTEFRAVLKVFLHSSAMSTSSVVDPPEPAEEFLNLLKSF